jgi:DNA-binding IclR family transcriptional regulator
MRLAQKDAGTSFMAVRRSHRLVELLAGRFFDGLSNKEAAEILGVTPSVASRDMDVLEDLGYAQQLANRRWSLTPKALAVYRAFVLHYEETQSRMAESLRNIEAGARRLG